MSQSSKPSKPYLEVPLIEEIEVSSLEEIAEASPVKEEHESLLLDAIAEKAERKEKKSREKEKEKLAKFSKKLRLLKKKEEAELRKEQKRCPYTGKYAWKNSLQALKSRNTDDAQVIQRLKSAKAPAKAPPKCKVCNKYHW